MPNEGLCPSKASLRQGLFQGTVKCPFLRKHRTRPEEQRLVGQVRGHSHGESQSVLQIEWELGCQISAGKHLSSKRAEVKVNYHPS